MDRASFDRLIDQILDSNIKGQVQVDFSGDGREIKVRFTNVSYEDILKLNGNFGEDVKTPAF